MKKISNFILLTCICFSIYSQHSLNQSTLNTWQNNRQDINGSALIIPDDYSSQIHNHYQNSKSIIKANQPKEIIEKLDSLIIEEFTENNQWELNIKREFTYDEEGNSPLNFIFFWDENNNEWLDHSKYEYSYDENGNITFRLHYIYVDNQWMYDYKQEWDFDENGNNILWIGFLWDENNTQWINNFKYELTYDENDFLIQWIKHNWDDGSMQWITDRKREYINDGNGNVMTNILFFWDEMNNLWITDSKTENDYDINDNKILAIHYDWDQDNNEWVNNWKTEYTYDVNDNMTSEIYLDWDETNNLWLYISKKEWFYDGHENPILYEISYYDEDNSQWVYDWKEECDYDPTLNFNNLAIPPYVFSEMYFKNGKLTDWTEFLWDDNLNAWNNDSRGTVYYSDFTGVGIDEFNNYVKSIVLPNPFSEKSIFSYFIESKSPVKLSIHNLNGQLISTLVNEVQPQGEQRVVLNGSELMPGIYFCVLKTNGGIQTTKMIKL